MSMQVLDLTGLTYLVTGIRDRFVLITRTVNGKALSSDIELTAEDVNAAPAAPLKAAVVTLTADGWTGDAAPYSQTVAVDDMTDTWIPGVPSIVATDTMETNQVMQIALGCVSQIVSTAGNLTFICYENKPANDITIRVPGVMV